MFFPDRGFCDALPDMEACGYEAHLPPSKDKNSSQLSTAQANTFHMITIICWLVEVVNGRFKRDFKFLRIDNFNTSVPHLFDHFHAAAALLNVLYFPINDNAYHDQIINIIHESMELEYHLAEYVIQKDLKRQRVAFVRMVANILELEDLPQLEEHLILIALGTYLGFERVESPGCHHCVDRPKDTVEHTVEVCPAWAEHHRFQVEPIGGDDLSYDGHSWKPWCTEARRCRRPSPPSAKQ